MEIELNVIAAICVALVVFYIFYSKNYWEMHNTPHEKPLCFFGNLAPVILRKTSMAEYLQSVYQRHGNRRYVGIYQFQKPALIIRDVELINQIVVREFDFFSQHTIFTSAKADPIWAYNLFAMPGDQKWKDMRATLSPAFTKIKLKALLDLIDVCAKQFVDHFLKEKDLVKLEMKEAFTKVTCDIIASVALGATCNSLTHPDNEIFKMGSEACNLGKFPKSLKFFVNSISPTLAKSERRKIFSSSRYNSFTDASKKEQLRFDTSDTVTEIAAESESPDTYREKSDKFEITDDVITAQGIIFFLAGFDTTSTAMSFAAYELALHPDIQQRLYEEIRDVTERVRGELNYDLIISMTYLDMVVSEVLRKWPPFAVTDRTTAHRYVIKPIHQGELPVPINQDVICLIPIFAIHRDEKYFPEPEVFNPERFAGSNHPPLGFFPFGKGRRSCIGSRFALLEIKVILIRILLKFEIFPIEETPIPIILSKTNVNPVSDRGYWLGLRPRDEQ